MASQIKECQTIRYLLYPSLESCYLSERWRHYFTRIISILRIHNDVGVYSQLSRIESFVNLSGERVRWTAPLKNGGVQLEHRDREGCPNPLPPVAMMDYGSARSHRAKLSDQRVIHPSTQAWGLRWPPRPGSTAMRCPGAEAHRDAKSIKRMEKVGNKT